MKLKYFVTISLSIFFADTILASDPDSYAMLDHVSFEGTVVAGRRLHHGSYIVPNEFNLADAEGLMLSHAHYLWMG